MANARTALMTALNHKPDKTVAFIIALFVSVSLCGALASTIDWDEFSVHLKNADGLVLIGCAACFAATILARGLRFAWLFDRLDHTGFRSWRAIACAAVNNFANHALPFRLGEVVFVIAAQRSYRLPWQRWARKVSR